MRDAHHSSAELCGLLSPLLERLGGLDLGAPDAAAQLSASTPMQGELVASIRTAALRGIEEGWLLPKEREGIRFGRVAADLHGFSVDAVLSSGPGPAHRHPNGEIDLLFALSGHPRFDGHPPGWAVYAPGTHHVPAVSGGEMLILYFLPAGAIEWGDPTPGQESPRR